MAAKKPVKPVKKVLKTQTKKRKPPVAAPRPAPTHTPLPGTMSARLMDLLERKHMSQRALANAVGIRQQSVHYLLHPPQDTSPKSRHLPRIADVLGVDPLWLETGAGEANGPRMITGGGERIGRRIPVYDRASVERRDPLRMVREMTTELIDIEGAFGVDAWDTAMIPDILPGDRLVFAPVRTLQPAPADVVLANCDGEVLLRRLRVVTTGKHPTFQLVAGNADFPTFSSANNKIALIAVLVEQRRMRRMEL